jgi:hypothetical protein
MKQNVGNFDRVARVLIAVAVALLYFTDQITGTLALILGLVAVILVATSLMSFCPIYKMLGLSTRKIEKPA